MAKIIRFDTASIPESHRNDIRTAVKILLSEGCKEIYLFGSLAKGEGSAASDIDLAVKGLKVGRFFNILGKLFKALNHPVDLVDLEKNNRFANLLITKGELLRVA